MSQAYSVLMTSKCSFSTQNYQQYRVCGVDIFEHDKIIKQCDIPKYIEGWLKSITIDDLKEISRLYIVQKEEINENAAGTYTPGLFKIVLLWDNHFKENSLPFKITALMTERTLIMKSVIMYTGIHLVSIPPTKRRKQINMHTKS